MNIDIGTVVNGLTVEAIAFERPGNWFLSCRNGHTGIFATTAMIEAGTVSCSECPKDVAARIKCAQRAIEIDEMLAAGREYEPGYLEVNKS